MIFESASSGAVWVSAIGGFFGVIVAAVTGWFALRGNREQVRLQAENERLSEEREQLIGRVTRFESEIELNRHALELKLKIEDWSRVQLLCNRLFHHAGVERILFLRGWNGRDALQYVTAVHQIRSDRSIHYDYIHYPVGENYNFHLRQAEILGVHFIAIDELEHTDEVAQLYHGEVPPITETAWSVLKGTEQGEDRVIKTYVSISTFAERGYKEADRNMVRRICFELQGIFSGDSPEIHKTA